MGDDERYITNISSGWIYATGIAVKNKSDLSNALETVDSMMVSAYDVDIKKNKVLLAYGDENSDRTVIDKIISSFTRDAEIHLNALEYYAVQESVSLDA